MFNRIKTTIAMRRETKREFKRIMNELREEEKNGYPARRPLHEDEKLMLDLARVQLHAETAAEIRNA